MKKLRLTAAVFVLLAAPVMANDTTAEIGAGGLSWVQSDRVSMKQEDLFLSRDEVRVDYLFANESKEDEESIVAFPMPDITAMPDSDMAVSGEEGDNFLGFSVVQDGRTITPQLQQRAIALGLDWTADLVAHNVPLLPLSEKTYAALASLPADVKTEWQSRGLIRVESFDAGKGLQEDVVPLWTLQSAYWWKTKFPAGKEVRVSHRYKPAAGGTVAMTFIEGGKPAYSYKDYVERYCIDESFMKTAARLETAAAAGKGPHYTENWLSYILTTGANWRGSIGKFTLTIDKGEADDFISFCGTGVKKTGPTTFQMTMQDFWPEKDLHILFLKAAN